MMLPEPHLFASVNKENLADNYPTTECTNVPSEPVNTSSPCDHDMLTQLCVSDRPELPVNKINLMCHPYNWSIKAKLSRKDHSNVTPSVQSNATYERRARRWYLIVIVLLYIGLITSFSLNVSLLLKSFPESAPAGINFSPQKLEYDKSSLYDGNQNLAK